MSVDDDFYAAQEAQAGERQATDWIDDEFVPDPSTCKHDWWLGGEGCPSPHCLRCGVPPTINYLAQIVATEPERTRLAVVHALRAEARRHDPSLGPGNSLVAAAFDAYADAVEAGEAWQS